MAQALSGIKVLDLTKDIAGAYSTLVMADMGAEVVKVESPEDSNSLREKGPVVKGTHPLFTAYNRNKKSITLRTELEEERKKLKSILSGFDVLVDDACPGKMQELGLDYDSLKEDFPSLITVSVTPYGSRGAYATRPGFEGTLQAESGVSFSVLDDSKGTPYLVGGHFLSVIGAQYAVIALLGALYARNTDGKGRRVESNAYYAACSMMQYNILDYIYNGVLFQGHGTGSPCGFIKTKDGMIRSNSHIQVMWERTLQLTDDPVMHEPRFMDGTEREKNEELLLYRMGLWLRNYTNKEIQKMFTKQGITVGIIRTIKDLLEDPHMLDRNQIVLIDVPGAGELPFFAAPYRMSGSKVQYHRAPVLGEHNAEYLEEAH